MISILLLVQQQGPTGEVNDVCWKLMSIAGLAICAEAGVIVVLAKKLWESAGDRLKDQMKIYDALNGEKRKEG